MSVYSVPLFRGNAGPAGTVLYTAPAGAVIVVRDVELYNGTAGTLSGGINYYVSGSSLGGQFAAVQNLVSGGTEHWEGRLVMSTGDILESGFGATGIYLLVSGYSLGP